MKRERLSLEESREHSYLNCDGSIQVPVIVYPILFVFPGVVVSSVANGTYKENWRINIKDLRCGCLQGFHMSCQIQWNETLINKSRKNGKALLFSCHWEMTTKRYNSPTTKAFCARPYAFIFERSFILKAFEQEGNSSLQATNMFRFNILRITLMCSWQADKSMVIPT